MSAPPAENVIDVGTIYAGAPLERELTIANTHTTKSMTVVGFEASCGCTQHRFKDMTVKPGARTTLAIGVNTLAHSVGQWAWAATVRVRLDGEAETTIPIRMTGTLVREVTVIPLSLSLSTEGAAIGKEIAIVDTRKKPLAITGMSATSKLIDVKSTTDGGLRVSVSETLPFGDYNETVVITTNDPLYPSFQIPVKVIKRKPTAVQFTPESVDLSREEPSLLVQFRHRDGKLLTIATCECDDKSLSLKWSKESGVAATLRVRLDAEGEFKAGQAEVRVKFNDPAGEMVTIPVKWK
ncbi:DUF1573 domain-containing protein [soil metagenome]